LKKNILVIDDDQAVLKTLARTLELEGYNVTTAQTGREAIEKSNSQFFNLALIDIRLSDIEGTELLTKMKETTPKMIKLIITGYPALANATEAINKGADGYIVKPVNMNKLLETVKEHLKKQQEATKYSEEKVVEYIESRAKEQETEEAKT
jgi:two-component system response regulator GlrR